MAEPTKNSVIEPEPYDVDVAGEDDAEITEKKGTSADRHAMWRMGKVQEMRVSCNPKFGSRSTDAEQRNFRFVSIFGFSMILMASWETMLGYVFATPRRNLTER
jgi:hypothetical protein